jgi:trimethylguanosine synthase
MTDDAWFGVTHESVANKIAKHIAAVKPKNRPIAIDVFAGVGGNTIALALSNEFKRVYAIEKDPATLKCAKHNAEIYGVADKITWWEGDCFDVLGVDTDNEESRPMATLAREHSVIFASPPWGGTLFPLLCSHT